MVFPISFTVLVFHDVRTGVCCFHRRECLINFLFQDSDSTPSLHWQRCPWSQSSTRDHEGEPGTRGGEGEPGTRAERASQEEREHGAADDRLMRTSCLQRLPLPLRLINAEIDSLIWWKRSRFSELLVRPGGQLTAGGEARLPARAPAQPPTTEIRISGGKASVRSILKRRQVSALTDAN